MSLRQGGDQAAALAAMQARLTEGRRLALLRESAGMSQAEAAQLLDMDPMTLSRKERGVSKVKAGERLAMEALYARRLESESSDAPSSASSAPAGTADAYGFDETLLDQYLSIDPNEEHPPEFYGGLQKGLMITMVLLGRSLRDTMGFLQRSLADAIAAQDRAIAMQKAIMDNTTPAARPAKVSKGGAPAKRPAAAPEKRRRPG